MVPPVRLERTTLGLEVLCSIQLSYGGIMYFVIIAKFYLSYNKE